MARKYQSYHPPPKCKRCIYGTYLQANPGDDACQLPANPGADYCGQHLTLSRLCVVRYCPVALAPKSSNANPTLCPGHHEEFTAPGQELSMQQWLATRPNEQAARVEGLPRFRRLAPGSASLESVGIALFLCFFGLFLLSIFALFAGATFQATDLIVSGALAFAGFLSVVAVLVVLDPKPPKSSQGEGDGDP